MANAVIEAILAFTIFLWDTGGTIMRLGVVLIENGRNRKSLIFRMPKRGLEPPRGDPHMTLNHARLPIPPLRQRREKI